MNSMTPYQRVVAAVSLQEPDRIPTAFHNSAVVAEISGLPYDEFFRNGAVMAEAHVRARELFQYDGIIVDSGTHCSAETLGCGAHYSDKKYPLTTTPVLQRLEDIDRLEMPDPESTYPACEMIACIGLLRQRYPDEVALIATGDQGPFTLAALLFGMEKWLLAVKDQHQPEIMHKVLDYACRYTTIYARALRRAGADIVRFGDSFGGTQVVSPHTYYQWTYPYEKQLIQALQLDGFPTSIHICGDATPILEGMINTGVNMIEVDEKTDFKAACEACAGRVALLGPVSPAHMVFQSVQEVKEEALQAIEIARSARTSLVLGAGCSMAGDTPFANIDAVVEAARVYDIK